MITVNSVSSGKTSSYMAVHYPADLNIFACVCIDHPKATPKDPAVLKYCLDKLNGNFIASTESSKSLVVMMRLEQLLGKDIKWVRGKSFDSLIREKNILPNWSKRFCTTYLKLIPMFEYCYFNHGEVIQQIGYRYDEFWRAYYPPVNGQRPVKRTEVTIEKYPVSCFIKSKRQSLASIKYGMRQYPLIDNRVERKQVVDFWKTTTFDFPVNSNCQGCFHKSKQEINFNYHESPELLQWFGDQEVTYNPSTWHDGYVKYNEVFNMKFTEPLFEAEGLGCSTGFCTD